MRGRDFDLALGTDCWHWRGVDAQGQPAQLQNIPLLSLPVENAALALQIYALLDLPWQTAALLAGLSAARMTGRLQALQLDYQGRTLQIMLDVAHNPHAASYLAERLKSHPIQGRRLAVLGVLDDKDLEGVLDCMQEQIADWAVAALPTARSCSATHLQQSLASRQALVASYATIAQAIEAQCAQAAENDQIIIFGSFL